MAPRGECLRSRKVTGEHQSYRLVAAAYAGLVYLSSGFDVVEVISDSANADLEVCRVLETDEGTVLPL